VDALLERLYREVRNANDRVRVGVSPFGVGRPDRRPPGIAGFSQFDAIYADAERWLENGWMDYLAPQLYWKSDSPEQPVRAPSRLLANAESPGPRHLAGIVHEPHRRFGEFVDARGDRGTSGARALRAAQAATSTSASRRSRRTGAASSIACASPMRHRRWFPRRVGSSASRHRRRR
jgi:hypothetical protein